MLSPVKVVLCDNIVKALECDLYDTEHCRNAVSYWSEFKMVQKHPGTLSKWFNASGGVF